MFDTWKVERREVEMTQHLFVSIVTSNDTALFERSWRNDSALFERSWRNDSAQLFRDVFLEGLIKSKTELARSTNFLVQAWWAQHQGSKTVSTGQIGPRVPSGLILETLETRTKNLFTFRLARFFFCLRFIYE